MLIIDGKTAETLVSPEIMLSAVERAFGIFGAGRFEMPNRFSCGSEDFTALYMPCFTEEHFGNKALTLVPANRSAGLPSIDGAILLNDRRTGKILAMIDAKPVTAWRTGATGALAAKLLSPGAARSLGIVGCGQQGLYQAICICSVRKIERLNLYNRSGVQEKFIASLRANLGDELQIVECRDAHELVAGSDIVATATYSSEPVLPADAGLLRGRCYIAVGSYKPDMRELPDELIRLADRVVADLPYACEESGDLAAPIASGVLDESRVEYLSDVLAVPHETAPGETVVFKTVGMALVDIVAAAALYKRAAEKGLGYEVEF